MGGWDIHFRHHLGDLRNNDLLLLDPTRKESPSHIWGFFVVLSQNRHRMGQTSAATLSPLGNRKTKGHPIGWP